MENELLCTESEQAAVAAEAARRMRFLLWIADRLEQSDAIEYRMEAAKALRQLFAA